MTSIPPQPDQQIHLIEFLRFALTGDGRLGQDFVSKYRAETTNREVERLCKFIRNATIKGLDADADETWHLMAFLAECLNDGACSGSGRTLLRSYVKNLRHKGSTGRENLSQAATAMVAFHTLRTGVVTLYASERSGQPPPIPWKKLQFYGYLLQQALVEAFPSYRALILCSYRSKLAEVYSLKGFRRHAKTRLSRVVSSIPEDLAITPRLRAEAHFNHATVCDDDETAYDEYLIALFNSKKVCPSKETASVEIKAFADMAQIHEKRGHLREAIKDHESALEAIVAYRDFWTPSEAAGWILQRSWLAGEALCLVGKYQLAADRFEYAASQANFLKSTKVASKLPHIAIGTHLKMRAEMLRAPANQASEIRRRYLADIEQHLAEKALETLSLPRAGYVKWFNFRTLWRFLTKRQEVVGEIQQYAADYPFILGDYEQTRELRNMLRRQLEILEAFGGPHARNYVGGLDVAPDTAFAFRFTMEAIIQAIRADENVISIDPNRFPEPQLMLLKAVVKNELSTKAICLQFELPTKILEAIDFCEVHLPQELFHALKYFADFIAKNPSYLTSTTISTIGEILNRMESIAMNYAHPEDSYLVRMKLRDVYNDIAASLGCVVDHCASILHSAVADMLSVCAERSQSYYSAEIEPGSNFTPEEMKIPAVMEFVRQSEALADARNRHFFSDGVVTEFGSGGDHYSQLLGSPARPDNSLDRHAATQSAVDRLRACQKGYAASLEEVRRAVRAFQPSRAYLRKFGGTPGPGVLRLHILLAAKRLVCIAFFADEVVASLLPQAQSESLCSRIRLLDCGGNAEVADLRQIGGLIDQSVRRLVVTDLREIEICIQPPLETIPWLLLREFVASLSRQVRYHYDVGVGFSANFAPPQLPKGRCVVLVGPPFSRSDLHFGSLEYHTSWQEEREVKRFPLPIEDEADFLDAMTSAKIVHFTGHVYHDDASPKESQILGKRIDHRGISLGHLQAQRSLLQGGVVLLNLCDSGRSGSAAKIDDSTVRFSQRTRSYEALAASQKAFAATFLTKGAQCVIATLWEMEDLPSFLFSYKLEALMSSSKAADVAVDEACHWLRSISRSDACQIIETAINGAANLLVDVAETKMQLNEQLAAIANGAESPFNEPRFWAGHIVFGVGASGFPANPSD